MLDLSILIGGEAGQGVQTVGEVLSRILIRSGFFVFSIQDYHSRIRGGHNFTQIRFSGQPVGALSEKIDILVCLNQETYDLHFSSVKDSGVILGSFSPFHAELSIVRFIPLDFEKIAQEVGNKLYANMVAIGTLMGVLGLDQAVALSYVDELLGKKGEDIAGANKRALGKGLSSIQLINNPVLLDRKTFPEKNPHLFILTGNEALGLGAICAGCTFYSAYPMTPSTGIMNYVATRASKYGILVEQAEDEIAAINMAIGASFAGARSMTATSGGGFCLMTEGLGLAAMTETPIVVVEAQRPGPSTGLPTRTSQGDLEFVLSASQDEFPRFVFAPRDPQNAIDVMVRAFNLTDRFQVPAIVLSDQYLADSAWTFQDLSLQEDGVSLQVSSALDDYRRYVITGDGISPRALPGEGNGVVIFDSDEHDEFGHLTEDLTIRTRMQHKRMTKLSGMRSVIHPPLVIPGQEMTLIGWGSTYGVLREVREKLGQEGFHVGMVHFSELYPLPAGLDSLFQVIPNPVVIEGNFNGQLARFLEKELHVILPRRINQYNGLPFLVDDVLTRVKEVGL